jgi:hypothetical protein
MCNVRREEDIISWPKSKIEFPLSSLVNIKTYIEILAWQQPRLLDIRYKYLQGVNFTFNIFIRLGENTLFYWDVSIRCVH